VLRQALVCLLLAHAGIGCSARGFSAGASEPVERPGGPLALADARSYVLSLINRDRAAAGLEPVELDPTAERAGQRHVEDMVRNGFTAHWGSDGSVPEQRYSEAGGQHFVQENAACFFDGEQRELDADPRFDPVELEKIESAFINETPPNDGHRKNILKPVHKLVGIGLAKPRGIKQPCMAQEFVDAYGEYEPLPAQARVGQTLRLAGEVREPVEFGGVGISRLDPAQGLSARHLNETSVYPVPEPHVLYFPAGYKTPKPVQVNGRSFSIDVPLDDGGRPGRYGVSVWGRYPGSEALVMVSLRVISVE
jgi:uncharacterized protein YkwD